MLSSTGSGGISKFHFAFVNFSASSTRSPDAAATVSLSCGAHPAKPSVPAAAAAAPATVAPVSYTHLIVGDAAELVAAGSVPVMSADNACNHHH